MSLIADRTRHSASSPLACAMRSTCSLRSSAHSERQ
eukprot:CAMPEP_0183376230 /NCGR_PEP_ID=MMETSP0164_2-20130417/119682_1 /TAXON_ID=221442 /ORGANISM="Coccolithus pelagicus ssp braarudi, Strain PLY182g" /LENGTH=35 /DNA_ID= /DNA_START= /DNA_END= /DNA_ORIENTATION=